MEEEKHEKSTALPNNTELDSDGGKGLLFRHFCNCLYLGHWELAKACVKQLHEGCQNEEDSVCSILKDIVRQPFNRR